MALGILIRFYMDADLFHFLDFPDYPALEFVRDYMRFLYGHIVRDMDVDIHEYPAAGYPRPQLVESGYPFLGLHYPAYPAHYLFIRAEIQKYEKRSYQQLR